MDIKSMAKSKRSHTKNNQPRKPNTQNHPNPTSSNKNPSNLTNENQQKKKVAPQKPSLPSNWDRYDDNVEEYGVLGQDIPIDPVLDGSGSVGVDSMLKKAVQGVTVKSKGADFSYLIAQAKESKEYYSPSFGDSLDDFYQGLAPMLDIKSGGIPSWDRDDDFLQENESTSEEAPNFSLDLKFLAEALAKADLAERLFIEPDLLPHELRGPNANMVTDSVPEKRLKTFETFEELYSVYLADKKIAETEEANKEDDISSSKDTETRIDDLGQNISHVTAQASSPKFQNLVVVDAREAPQDDQVSKQEAELDSLLNSFNDTSLPNSRATSITQQGNSMSNIKGNTVTHQAPLPQSRDASNPTQITSSLDDELDDLLDASKVIKKSDLFPSIKVDGGAFNDIATRGAPLECFLDPSSRSPFPVSSCSLDDELDNLLEETSKPTKVKTNLPDFPPSSSLSLHPGSDPKVLDDFDSWLDTL